MKNLFILIGLLTFSILPYSCTDSCEGITCEFDGVCDNGDCVCSDVTAKYLVGVWTNSTLGTLAGTFNADNTFTDSFGNKLPWTLNSATNTISLSTFSTITVKDDGFSCNQMNVTVKNSLGTKDYTFARK